MIANEMQLATDPAAARLTVGNRTEAFGHQLESSAFNAPPSISGQPEYTISASCERSRSVRGAEVRASNRGRQVREARAKILPNANMLGPHLRAI